MAAVIALVVNLDVLASGFHFHKLDVNNKISNHSINAFAMDDQGYLLFSTNFELWKFDGYKAVPFRINMPNNTKGLKNIRDLLFDSSHNLWIGSTSNGLIRYTEKNQSVLSFNTESSDHRLMSNTISALELDQNGDVWVGTDLGLHLISMSSEVSYFPFNESQAKSDDTYITSILDNKTNELLVSTKKGVYVFDKSLHTYESIRFNNFVSNYIFSIYKDENKNIWLSTDKGLFVNNEDGLFKQFKPEYLNLPVTSVVVQNHTVWVGVFNRGLYKVSLINDEVTHYEHLQNNENSLASNSISSLVLDKNNLLWITTFDRGINFIDTNTISFGMYDNSQNSVYCSGSNSFNGFIKDESGTLWIATDTGLVKWNQQNNVCVDYKMTGNSEDEALLLYSDSLTFQPNGNIWMSTGLGLFEFDLESDQIRKLPNNIDTGASFTVPLDDGLLLVGSWNGLYKYNIKEQEFKKFKVQAENLKTANFYNYQISTEGGMYFSSDSGVLTLTNDDTVAVHQKVQSQLPTKDILSLLFFDQDLLIGTFQHGLYHFDSMGNLKHHYNESNQIPSDSSIYNILEDGINFWLSTENGLIKLNIKEKTAHTFYQSDGLKSHFFNLNAAYKSSDGMLFFGSRNGFNGFYPQDIKLNMTPPNVVLTDFTRFGQSIKFGNDQGDFILKKDINLMDELILNHKDYVIGFEFAALDLADASRNLYAFKMEGLDPQWTYTAADQRRISYSNLSPGKYTFKVKGANKDGVWNEVGKSLKITVKPAPWFSWWALLGYSVSIYFLISWYINKKNQQSKAYTQKLKTEVEEQTKELKRQKQTVEDLLSKKNELFANISHEFRTPLTLILGPVNNLLKSNLHQSNINSLKMVKRNANRLLTMIEQLLELAKISGSEKVQFFQVETQPVIKNLVNSFAALADEKRIRLQLSCNDPVVIETSNNALEIVLGNLLSNAIKYTQTGGNITVTAKKINDQLSIAVKDEGCGLDEQQKEDIFNRFKRLDSHQNIEGTGIGLSVVEEVIETNGASIHITSKPGLGSTFTVDFNVVERQANKPSKFSESQLIKQLTLENTTSIQKTTDDQTSSHQKENILVIDDNPDMREHIAATLREHYQCSLAEGGKAGIALALKLVPDIIICDVMMPEMDGFQVSRILRSDSRTSHIPLVLLTALDSKESRIKGWREHVDAYLTKPFDADELLLQLENISVIRNILMEKNRSIIKAGKKAPSNIDLPQKDQEFVNKLNMYIAKNYKNSLITKANLAKNMAVSERQLQRKLKALINKNPMDILREYRLSQAAIMLKDGYQVSITSDECGFNSLPHFSKCFKSQYGLSPKVYQQTCNNK